MNGKFLLSLFAALSLLFPVQSSFLHAQIVSGPRVEITITDELVPAPGEIRTAQRDSTGALITRPGDVIRYTLTAVNSGTQPAYEAEIVDPIPEGTEYFIGSASGDGMTITYSIDDGNFFQPQPITYEFRNPDGTIEKRPAAPDMYTHIKWLVTKPIQPRSSVSATFRVRVSLPDTTKEVRQ